jgi:hypothetical protein
MRVQPDHLACQEVILRIGQLDKLGSFESTADFFVYIASVSLASGPILNVTSWHAKVIHGQRPYVKMILTILVIWVT